MKMCHCCFICFMINGPKIKIGFYGTEGGFYFSYGIINCPLHLFIFLIKCGAQQVITFFVFKRLLFPYYIGNSSFIICLGFYIVIFVNTLVFGFEPANSFPYFFLLFMPLFLPRLSFICESPCSSNCCEKRLFIVDSLSALAWLCTRSQVSVLPSTVIF